MHLNLSMFLHHQWAACFGIFLFPFYKGHMVGLTQYIMFVGVTRYGLVKFFETHFVSQWQCIITKQYAYKVDVYQ